MLYSTAQDGMQVTLMMISESHHQTHQFEDSVMHELLQGFHEARNRHFFIHLVLLSYFVGFDYESGYSCKRTESHLICVHS